MFKIAIFLVGAISGAAALAGTALFASNEFDKTRRKLKKAFDDVKRDFGDDEDSIKPDEKKEKTVTE